MFSLKKFNRCIIIVPMIFFTLSLFIVFSFLGCDLPKTNNNNNNNNNNNSTINPDNLTRTNDIHICEDAHRLVWDNLSSLINDGFRIYILNENSDNFVFVRQVNQSFIHINDLPLLLGINWIRIREVRPINIVAELYSVFDIGFFDINYTHETRQRQAPYGFEFIANGSPDGHRIAWNAAICGGVPIVYLRRGQTNDFVLYHAFWAQPWINIRRGTGGGSPNIWPSAGLNTFRVFNITSPGSEPYRHYAYENNLIRVHYTNSEFAYYDLYVHRSANHQRGAPEGFSVHYSGPGSGQPLHWWISVDIYWSTTSAPVEVSVRRAGSDSFELVELPGGSGYNMNLFNFTNGLNTIRAQHISSEIYYQNGRLYTPRDSDFVYLDINISITAGQLPPIQSVEIIDTYHHHWGYPTFTGQRFIVDVYCTLFALEYYIKYYGDDEFNFIESHDWYNFNNEVMDYVGISFGALFDGTHIFRMRRFSRRFNFIDYAEGTYYFEKHIRKSEFIYVEVVIKNGRVAVSNRL